MSKRPARPKGSPKVPGSGRKKGSRNKKPTNLRRFLDEHYPNIGEKIVAALMSFAFDQHDRADLRLKALVELRDMKWGRPPQMVMPFDSDDPARAVVTQVILAPRD